MELGYIENILIDIRDALNNVAKELQGIQDELSKIRYQNS